MDIEKDLKHFLCLSGKVNRFFCQFLGLIEQPENCYVCCRNPEIITLDGIVLSVETKKISRQNLQAPWISGESNLRYNNIKIFNFIRVRISTRIERSIISLTKSHGTLLEDFTNSEKGMDRDGYLELKRNYQNPCISLLVKICDRQLPPYRCPEIVRSFFRSIRKAVCPAITITPTILWGYLRIYLDDGKNEALVINNLLI